MGNFRLWGRAGTNGFVETCLKVIGVVLDHIWCKRKWSKVMGKETKVPYLQGQKYEEKMSIKGSSSTTSCQQIHTRFGGKSEGWVWSLLAKWQPRCTKKDGVTSQHELIKCPLSKSQSLKMKKQKERCVPVNQTSQNKDEKQGVWYGMDCEEEILKKVE